MTTIWDNAVKIAMPLCILLVGAVIVNRISIREIQVSRFTDRDGSELERRLLEARPPQYLRDDITEIKQLMRDFDIRLRRVEIATGAHATEEP